MACSHNVPDATGVGLYVNGQAPEGNPFFFHRSSDQAVSFQSIRDQWNLPAQEVVDAFMNGQGSACLLNGAAFCGFFVNQMQ